jgi:hypothetical protein
VNANFFIIIGVITAAVTSFFLPYGFYLKSHEKRNKQQTAVISSEPTLDYKNITHSKKSLEKTIELLHVEAQLNYFINLLGSPRFKDKFGQYNEYIFVNKYSYIQAVTDMNNTVKMFSVTTRREDFSPKIVTPFLQELILGKTIFSEIESTPQEIRGMLYARLRHLCYYEIYLVNPGNYQYFILSINPTGFINKIGDTNLLSRGISFPENAIMDENLINFRNDSSINTYSITSPLFTEFIKNDDIIYGPDRINFGPRIDQVTLTNNWIFPGSEKRKKRSE